MAERASPTRQSSEERVQTGKACELAHHRRHDCDQLHGRELLTDAVVAASAERQVRRLGSLRDEAISIIILLCIRDDYTPLARVPPVRVPKHQIGEVLAVARAAAG